MAGRKKGLELLRVTVYDGDTEEHVGIYDTLENAKLGARKYSNVALEMGHIGEWFSQSEDGCFSRWEFENEAKSDLGEFVYWIYIEEINVCPSGGGIRL